jgi:hypothetical protein
LQARELWKLVAAQFQNPEALTRGPNDPRVKAGRFLESHWCESTLKGLRFWNLMSMGGDSSKKMPVSPFSFVALDLRCTRPTVYCAVLPIISESSPLGLWPTCQSSLETLTDTPRSGFYQVSRHLNPAKFTSKINYDK